MYKTKLAFEIYLLKITIFNNLLNSTMLDFTLLRKNSFYIYINRD